MFVKSTLPYLFLFTLLSLVVSACGAEATPEPTETSPPPTETSVPTATEKPTRLPPIGTDITVLLPEGDAEKGQRLAGGYYCNACHLKARYGPFLSSEGDDPAIAERAESRIAASDYSGTATNVQEYLIEAIIVPDIYLAPGDWDESHYMSTEQYDKLLNVQNVADIIAWMYTIE